MRSSAALLLGFALAENLTCPAVLPDPEEFLTIVMHHILALEPLLKL